MFPAPDRGLAPDSISRLGSESNPTLAGYVSEHVLAPELGISLRTLRRWHQERTGPLATRVGRFVYYSREAVAAWLRASEQKPCRTRRARAA